MTTAHEKALANLKAMFGAASPWTEQQLDAVLRHHDGNVNVAAETVLGHGDGGPAELLERLQNPSDAVHKYRRGQIIRKYFPSRGKYYRGMIDHLVTAEELSNGVPGVPYYFVKYDDGDEEHMAEDEIASYVITGEFAPGYSGDDDQSSEDDAKPPAQKRTRTAAVDSQYVEGGRTFFARVTGHREVQSGPEKSVLKFFVEWRQKSDVTTAATATSSSAMLSSSWTPLKEFIAPSAALDYLERNTHLPQWQKDALVGTVTNFLNQLKRDNTFKARPDEPLSCSEIDFCCYVCTCKNHLEDKVVRCGTIVKYHRACCHKLDTAKKLNNFCSCLGREYEKFLNQTTAGDTDGGESEEKEMDKKRERDIENILNSRTKSAVARETQTDNDLALPAPESQRLTDETAVSANQNFQRLCKERKTNPGLKREAVVLEVFAGIGGATVALKKLGIALKTVVVVEHDRAAVAVHRANHDPSYGSGSAVDDGVSYIYSLYETYEELEANLKAIVREIGPVDIIVGGPPCQDHSKVNARRKGADGVHGRYM